MKIDLSEALALIKSGDWLNIRFITADVLKGSGGRVLEFPKCRLARKKTNHATPDPSFVATAAKKNPHHNFHFTLNVELPGGHTRKIHPILVTHVNNQAVL